MAGKTNLPASSRHKRDQVEIPAFSLGMAQTHINHVQLRIRQALRRAALDDLLVPALEHLEQAVDEINSAQDHLASQWHQGQQERWKK